MQRGYKKLAVLAALLPISQQVFGSETTVANASSFNPVLIAFVTLIVILLFAIAVMGGVLKELSGVYREKVLRKGADIKTRAITLLAMILLPLSSIAEEAVAETEQVKAGLPEVVAGLPATEFYALSGIVLLELLILGAMLLYMRGILRAISQKPEKIRQAAEIVRKRVPFWDRFNQAVELEKEEDIMLDHDYDGIKELDNSLPPWWKYGFYLTILISVVYLWYYHGGGNGPSSHDEYIAEVQRGEEQKAAYLAKSAGNIDETNVTMADASGIEEGKTLYQKSCAACHGADGGGTVGPNLADDYWLHGGSLQDVFKSIKYGWQDKGMKPWKDDFTPKQLANITSFVKSLKGTKPAAPKEQQGELYVETEGTATETAVEEEIAVQ